MNPSTAIYLIALLGASAVACLAFHDLTGRWPWQDGGP